MDIVHEDALDDEAFALWLSREREGHRLQPVEYLEYNNIFVTSTTPCVLSLRDTSYVLVQQILHNTATNEYQIRGFSLRRTRESQGLLDAKRNEVYIDVTYINDHPIMVNVNLEQIVERKPAIFTNLSREAFARQFPREARAIRQDVALFCRWKQVNYTIAVATTPKTRTKWRETSLQRLNQSAGDMLSHLYSVPNATLKQDFRQADIAELDAQLIDLTRDEPNNHGLISNRPNLHMTESSPHRGSEDTIILSDEDEDAESAEPPSSSQHPVELTSSPHGSEDAMILTDDDEEYEIVDISFGAQPVSDEPSSVQANTESIEIRDDNEDEDLVEVVLNSEQSPADTIRARSASVQFLAVNIRVRPQYTIADAFCGGGGVSRGASDAGLRVRWAFDAAEEMCRTYAKNFCTQPGSFKVVHIDAHSFLTNPRYGTVIDILHLSPPCQFFSPAHTRPGPHDEANTAASFCIMKFLQRFHPRIVTLENTKGLPQGHQDYLAGVLNQFTSAGYNVRWKIIHMANYGIPQTRERLIILASCPGEPLPSFPPETHSRNGTNGLKPWRTINNVLANIPRNALDHNPETEPQINKPAFDGNIQAKTLCTGTFDYHPSGKRQFTIRELASLQGFPLNHVFPRSLSKTMIRKQIGNAVPPLFAKRLYTHLRKALEKADGF